jgi:hypothetical protein
VRGWREGLARIRERPDQAERIGRSSDHGRHRHHAVAIAFHHAGGTPRLTSYSCVERVYYPCATITRCVDHTEQRRNHA